MKLNPTIKRMLLFLLIFLAVNEGVKLYFFKVSVQNHMLVRQENQFNKYDGPLTYLFLGHSRPGRAIDTSIIDGSYVYGSGGESNVSTYYKLKYLLENHAERIENIILPLGLTSVTLKDPSRNINSFYWSKYVDYFELAEITGDYPTYLKIYAKAKVVPYYEYPYLRLMEACGELRIETSDEEFANASDEERLELASRIVENQAKYRDPNDSVARIYVEKTIELAKMHNKQLVYVKYPLTPYYRQAVEKFDMEWITGQEVNDSLVLSYQKEGVLYFDYSSLFDDHVDYFKDTHHLNAEGRTVFTELFWEDLQKHLK